MKMDDIVMVGMIIIAYTIIVAGFGFAKGVDAEREDVNNKCYQQAVKHHVAEHNATTGVFEWLK